MIFELTKYLLSSIHSSSRPRDHATAAGINASKRAFVGRSVVKPRPRDTPPNRFTSIEIVRHDIAYSMSDG